MLLAALPNSLYALVQRVQNTNPGETMDKSGKDGLLGNKIAAGVLTAGLVLWGANRIAHSVMSDEAPEKPAIKIAALPSAAPAQASKPAGPESILPLLAKADVAKGMAFVQQQCAACHTFTQGGANGVGPNLYDVVGAPMFAHTGFSYSAAVKAKAHGNWTYDEMNEWLYSPSNFAPGTGMSYPGIHNTQTRADVVAYLRTLSNRPVPLPSASQIKSESEEHGASAAPPATAPAENLTALLAHADPAKGKALFEEQCTACHTIAKGGANGVGPNLYGVVGSKSFSASGFDYSDAVKPKAGKPWTAARLDDWLKSPAAFAPGTHMAYPGIKNDQTRADMIAYLNQNSASPVKLP
ncbi:Cytochrome c2 [Acidocella aminolytica 101 = DSM 11237]|uniref:Cytochrome c class I n=2 Tax=Acidocella TaxID=50709 RepID=A0A0D6PGG3_9PROT|nr:cytochrome c class I [Acidocella aminolytica 101 = DSM 11237]GBQ36854.1 cytochrome c2 [Acidocella aminolytica 101 = DSM 11237]SHE59024.1 Cytochrome c2 [Acidocella aminolytica 101 = DSM 11237]